MKNNENFIIDEMIYVTILITKISKIMKIMKINPYKKK